MRTVEQVAMQNRWVRLRGEFRALLHCLGLVPDRGVWIEENAVFACPFPRNDTALADLAARGITLLINLHQERRHSPDSLARHRLTEVRLPVPDYAAPTPSILATGIRAILRARARGQRVAVHCGGGLGRTGTLLACYLLATDPALRPADALARIRAKRPGSVETTAQEEAIENYAKRRRA